MTIILISRDSRGRWMAESDTSSLPKILRKVPVFQLGDYDESALSYEEVRRQVKACNPGQKVVLK